MLSYTYMTPSTLPKSRQPITPLPPPFPPLKPGLCYISLEETMDNRDTRHTHSDRNTRTHIHKEKHTHSYTLSRQRERKRRRERNCGRSEWTWSHLLDFISVNGDVIIVSVRSLRSLIRNDDSKKKHHFHCQVINDLEPSLSPWYLPTALV